MEPKIEVYQVNLSFDANKVALADVLSALSALIDYSQEIYLGYDELETVEIER